MASTSTPRSKQQTLAGWGNAPREQGAVYRPERVSEAVTVVTSAPEPTVLARGLGRSYGDASLNHGGAILLSTRLSRFLGFDPASGVLECEAGASIEEIINVFLPRGYFPPVTPGTKYVTLGGAIAADVHGKNHHRDGSIGEFVESLELLLASGQTLRCSRQENPEAFWATIGGMGLTGVILSARLRLIKVASAYLAVDYKKAPNLDAALKDFAEGDSNYQYSVAWIDCLASGDALGRSVLIRGNHAAVAELPAEHRDHPLQLKPKRKKNVPFFFPGFALSSMSVRLFNEHFFSSHEEGRKIVDYDEFFYPLDSVLNWNRIYGKRGFYQYQAVFPATDNSKCLRELLQKVSGSGRPSFLCVLKTMAKGSGGMLSFPQEGQTLAIDIPNHGGLTIPFLQELDGIVLKHGGRVYLAKDAAMSPEAFAAMYPRLGEFNAVKKQLDPTNRISSTQSRRLKIGEAV